MYDGSYVRLKNAEIAYNFTQNLVESWVFQDSEFISTVTTLLLGARCQMTANRTLQVQAGLHKEHILPLNDSI
jgi:hypothetical protein